MHQTLIYFPALLKMKAFIYAKKKWKQVKWGHALCYPSEFVAVLGVLISGGSYVYCLLLR